MVAEGPAGPAGPAPDGRAHPAFRMTRWRRAGDAVIGLFIRAGVVPNSYLMTTVGRKTGLPRTTPVTLVEREDRRWLVAPYGAVSWVHNAHAAGWVTLHRRGHHVRCAVREVGPEEAGPVLKEYVGLARPTRPYFDAAPDAPVEQFVAEAGRHPVFELTVEPDGPTAEGDGR